MRVRSQVMVQDPVDAYELSAAAAVAAGLPRPARGWHLYDLGAVSTLQADEEPDDAVAVSVHFTAAGDGLPPCDNQQLPGGYALVWFVTAGRDPVTDRLQHLRQAAALGQWLGQRSLRWCWQYDDEPWGTRQPARPSPRAD